MLGHRLLLAIVVLVGILGLTGPASAQNFGAYLIGAEEVTPAAVSTGGQGFFFITVADTPPLNFVLLYFGLESTPVVAHIHLGQRNTSGGVSVFLCGGGGKPACPANGTQVAGTITAADVVGPAAQGIAAGEFDELVRAIRGGNTYVNVHSVAFPQGEIRGQIR